MNDQTQTRDGAAGPLLTFRDGAVVVKLWQQEGPNGPFVTATLGRTYKDEASGEYREARSLTTTDMLKAQALLADAHRHAVRWRQQSRHTPVTDQSEPGDSPDAAQRQTSQGLAEQRDAAFDRAKAPASQEAAEPGLEAEPDR